MEQITKELVLQICKEKKIRKIFNGTDGTSAFKSNGLFEVNNEAIEKILEQDTGVSLKYTSATKTYSAYLTPEQAKTVRAWEISQGSTVFIRNKLYACVALDMNKTSPKENIYTYLGIVEKYAKHYGNNENIDILAAELEKKIHMLPYYRDADFICAIPSNKNFDLPRELAAIVSNSTGKPNITCRFNFKNDKASVKNVTTKDKLSIEDKWSIWEKTGLAYMDDDHFKIKDKTVVLIDDKYQSGITMQFVAMLLQQAGAREIYGLSVLKTLKNGKE